jgi:hypothetical protein
LKNHFQLGKNLKVIEEILNFLIVNIKLFSIFIGVITIGTGIYQYRDKKNQEFRKRFWEERLSLYKEATTLAAKIAIADNMELVTEERKRFWELYWGPLCLIEDKNVEAGMVNFGNALKEKVQNEKASTKLTILSIQLAKACRISLKKTWQPVKLSDLKEKT